MNISEAGLDLIKKFEGFRSKKYKDVAGFWTIGYGHKLISGEYYPDGIDDKKATDLLEKDVVTAEQAVTKLVKVSLTQGEFDALTSFVFNLGAGRLAGSTLLKDLNSGNYEAAGEQLLLWDHAGGKELSALKIRREAELDLWEGR